MDESDLLIPFIVLAVLCVVAISTFFVSVEVVAAVIWGWCEKWRKRHEGRH